MNKEPWYADLIWFVVVIAVFIVLQYTVELPQ